MINPQREIIVTGVNGFVGEHLARHLKAAHFLVGGIGRDESPHENVAQYLDSYQQVDLQDQEQVNQLIVKNATAIIHLAGLASVADSFNKPDLYKIGNAEMTENLLKTAKDQGFTGRIVAVSTGAIYDPNQPMPLAESSQTIESSPYVIGKLRAEKVIKQYRSNGLNVIIARPFNHIGPGQGTGFLVPDLYDQLIAAKESGSSNILVGNLSTKRDYTDVRDIVAAYTQLATADSLTYDIYNIASGTSYSGFEILTYLQKEMDLESIKPSVDPTRVRPTDAADIIGDASRLRVELGWEPQSNPMTAITDFVTQQKS